MIPRMLDVVIRRVPGHHWVRPFATFGGHCEPGHGWLYHCIRRDAWVIGPVGFGLMRMPYNRHLPAKLRHTTFCEANAPDIDPNPYYQIPQEDT